MSNIRYPTGFEPNLWNPNPEVQKHRFVLGNTMKSSSDDPPLIALCMNPSYADHTVADKTVNNLIKSSRENKNSGWVVLNLYPERSTDPKNLKDFNAGLSAQNCEAIEQVLTQFKATEVLGAWGGLKHPTLRRAKTDVLDTIDRLGVKLFTFDGLTAGDEPRHPMPRGTPLLLTGPKRFLTRIGNRLVEVAP